MDQLCTVAIQHSDGSAKFAAATKNSEKRDTSERTYRPETDVVIWSTLQEDPNASLRTIAETMLMSPETDCTHVPRMGCTPKILLWISHALTCELKQVCPQYVCSSFTNSGHRRTIIGGLLSRGTKTVLPMSMFEIEYG
jgi:hypothetical protein